MIDWCIQCADAGCIITKHTDTKHRMFAYIFVRIMKDALISSKESDYFIKHSDYRFELNSKFYKNFIQYECIISKLWFKKSYWAFMEHMISEAYPEFDSIKVNIKKDGSIMFRKKKCIRKE